MLDATLRRYPILSRFFRDLLGLTVNFLMTRGARRNLPPTRVVKKPHLEGEECYAAR